MKYLRLFESVSIEDIIRSIESNTAIYVTAIKTLPDHNPEEPVRVVSVANDGTTTIEVNGEYYDVSLRNVTKIER